METNFLRKEHSLPTPSGDNGGTAGNNTKSFSERVTNRTSNVSTLGDFLSLLAPSLLYTTTLSCLFHCWFFFLFLNEVVSVFKRWMKLFVNNTRSTSDFELKSKNPIHFENNPSFLKPINGLTIVIYNYINYSYLVIYKDLTITFSPFGWSWRNFHSEMNFIQAICASSWTLHFLTFDFFFLRMNAKSMVGEWGRCNGNCYSYKWRQWGQQMRQIHARTRDEHSTTIFFYLHWPWPPSMARESHHCWNRVWILSHYP